MAVEEVVKTFLVRFVDGMVCGGDVEAVSFGFAFGESPPCANSRLDGEGQFNESAFVFRVGGWCGGGRGARAQVLAVEDGGEDDGGASRPS